MNFKINKRIFLDALNIAAKAISVSTPLPILGGIKLSLENNLLTIISSDSNISIKTVIKNENDKDVLMIESEGDIVVESKDILEIVRKIDSDLINIEVFDDSLVKIYGGKSEFKINSMKAGDYPFINFEINNTPFKFDTYTFFKIVDETSFACSEKDTRPVLTGVNFRADSGKLYVNATDSYRLASKVVPIDEKLFFNITIPKKYLNDIYHSISNVEEVEIVVDNQKIIFIFNNTIIEARLLDDEFPDVSRLIPQSYSKILVVKTKELIGAVDRSSFIKAEGKNVVKLNINEKEVIITSVGTNGSSYENVSVVSFEGDPFEISCSGKYLIDAIKAIGADEVTLSFSGDLKPFVISDKNDDSIIQLISPVRTYK